MSLPGAQGGFVGDPTLLAPNNTFLYTGCTDLLLLNLHNNDISVIADNAFSHLPNLTRLTMSNNVLTQLYDNTLFGLFSLTELYLQFNIGLQISDNAFDDLGNLQKLILERAYISQVSAPRSFVISVI